MADKIDFKNLSKREKIIFKAGCISMDRKNNKSYDQGVSDQMLVSFIDDNDWFESVATKPMYEKAKSRLNKKKHL